MFFFHLLKTGIKASISKRWAFLIESAFMLANNLLFIVLWAIFFRQFYDVAGWNFHDLVLLMAIGTGSYGLMQVIFGGVRNLSKMIIEGDLDPFMTQPKNLLLHVAGSKSHSKGWGHLLTAILLMFLAKETNPYTLLLVVLGLICGCLVFTSINIIVHSLPFWLGSLEGVAKKYCDSVFLFALYPNNIYSGLLQVMMFTVLPAGLISYMPVELIRSFSWLRLALLVSSALLFTALAFYVFYAGLRRYESGNRFGIRH